jgi:predicted nuclease with RNAse H fold/GNAT superfamily N-acetyltransferase
VQRWLGVDVGGARKGFDIALIDDRQVAELSGGLNCADVVELVVQACPAVVAIDSPRDYARRGETTRDGERQLNRAVCGIRWTPDRERVQASPYYAWILEGLALFDALAAHEVEVIEVFPTASWTRWFGGRGSRSRAAWSTQGLAALGLAGLPARTNQDQRDAVAAAVTARQHTQGLTETMGTIVVPAGPISVPTTIGQPTGHGGLVVRRATQSDLGALLSLYKELAAEKTTAAPGGSRVSGSVLTEILDDPHRELVVAARGSDVVGTADLLVVPNLTHRAEPWAIVENVIVSATARREGIGRALMAHLLEFAGSHGCFKVQLVSGKHRAEAHRFYRSMGLEAVAEGFKIYYDE